LKDLTIRQRILVSFGAILALMIATCVVALSSLQAVDAEAHLQREHSLPGQLLSAEMRVFLRQGFTLVQQHMLSPETAEKERIRAEIEANRSGLRQVFVRFQALPIEEADSDMISPIIHEYDNYVSEQNALLAASDVGVDDALRERLTSRFLPAFRKIHNLTQILMDNNQKEAELSANKILEGVEQLQRGLIASFLVAVLLAIVCCFFLLRAIGVPLAQLLEALGHIRHGDFTRRLEVTSRDEFGELAEGFNRMVDELTALVGQIQKTGVQVTTSVTEVAATTRQQQATAGEIATTTVEIGATSKEISATSKELVRTMSDVARVADQSASLAASSQTGLLQMRETMRHVMGAASGINAKLGVLNEKAGTITQMITTITKVADQTNLLSLNAAIEAEKAGEYGKGFSVVATQIRRLADQTAVATYDIELMVKEIQSAVSASVMGMDKFSEEVRQGMEEVQTVSGQLNQIIEQVQALAPRFDSVSEGVQAQSVGAEQITEALLQLSEAAQQTVESIRQSGLAIDDLNQTAQTLRGGVSRFRLQS
tara:strand:- start:49914 stop:51539 length:1626 start_codon:yes stop_codon:yes gene_type:complete